MRTVLWVALLFDLIALVLIAGAKLDKYQMSDFAFKQKLLELAPDQARLLKRLHKNLSEVRTQQMLEQTVLGAIAIGIFSHLVNPPVLGLLYSLGVFLIISLLIKIRFIEQIALRVFEGSLEVILSVVETTKPLLRAVQAKHRSFQILPGSQEEFMDQLRRLPSTILTPIQRQRLEDVLASEQKTTKDIMTPKKKSSICRAISHAWPDSTQRSSKKWARLLSGCHKKRRTRRHPKFRRHRGFRVS